MASAELQRLHRLHLIDKGILEVRARAANLDVGKAESASLKAAEEALANAEARAKTLGGELTDLELKNASIDERLKKLEAELFGGAVVGQREVDRIEREKAAQMRQREANDARLLQLFELVPEAKKTAERAAKAVETAKAAYTAKRKAAIETKKKLEDDFHRLTTARPDAVQGISPNLLARYDGIRQRANGVGMADVEKRTSCGACGMNLPERTLAGLKDDKVLACESCHRILYYTEGVI